MKKKAIRKKRNTAQTRATALNFSLLISLALLVSPSGAVPARAGNITDQSLSLSSHATAVVNGSGTKTTGPVVYGSAAGPGSIYFYQVDTFDTSVLTLQNGGAITILNTHDASTANIEGGDIYYNVVAADHSVVNVTGGASGIGADDHAIVNVSGGITGVKVEGTSTLNLSGGVLNNLSDFATANITGGTIVSAALAGSNHGVLNMSGGSIEGLFSAFASSVNISGGTVFSLSAVDSTVQISGNAALGDVDMRGGSADVSGGSLTSLSTHDNALVSLSGGSTGQVSAFGDSTIDVTGGVTEHFFTDDNASIDIFGTGLNLSVDPQGFAPSLFDITGTLEDGEAIDAQYSPSNMAGGSGHLLFNGVLVNVVPEASTTASFGLLLALGLGGVLVAAKRKKAGSIT